MEYLCLVYLDGKRLESVSRDESAAIDRDSLAYDEDLRRRGHMVAARALAGPRTAVSVRPRAGGASMTDGPFVETKEHLGGFILIEARDMNEAMEIAAKIPIARFGGVEVRPILRLERDEAGNPVFRGGDAS